MLPAQHDISKPRIEPSFASVANHSHRCVESFLGDVRFERLRDQQNARQQRNRLARNAGGMSQSAPLFIHERDRLGGVRRKAELRRDGRAALATCLDDLSRHVLRAGDHHEVSNPCKRRAPHPTVLRGAPGKLPPILPIDEAHVALDVLVVRSEQCRHARCVAAASGILEQRRVVERFDLRRRQRDRSSKAHGEHTGAQRMSGSLSFRQVERERERREHFRKANCGIRTVRGRRGRRRHDAVGQPRHELGIDSHTR